MRVFIFLSILARASEYCFERTEQECLKEVECEVLNGTGVCSQIHELRDSTLDARHDIWTSCSERAAAGQCVQSNSSSPGCDECNCGSSGWWYFCIPTAFVEKSFAGPACCRSISHGKCDSHTAQATCAERPGCFWAHDVKFGEQFGRCFLLTEYNEVPNHKLFPREAKCSALRTKDACEKDTTCTFCPRLNSVHCVPTEALATIDREKPGSAQSLCKYSNPSVYGCGKYDQRRSICTASLACQYEAMAEVCDDIVSGVHENEVNKMWDTCAATKDCGKATSADPGCDLCKLPTSDEEVCVPSMYISQQQNIDSVTPLLCSTIRPGQCSSYLTEAECTLKDVPCRWAYNAEDRINNGGCFDIEDTFSDQLLIIETKYNEECQKLGPDRQSCESNQKFCSFCFDLGCLSKASADYISDGEIGYKCSLVQPIPTTSFLPREFAGWLGVVTLSVSLITLMNW